MIWCLEFRRVFFFFQAEDGIRDDLVVAVSLDRKSTRLNSSHQIISYAVFGLKKETWLSHKSAPGHAYRAAPASVSHHPLAAAASSHIQDDKLSLTSVC